jgi:large conductance mechanosensitive channel
MLKEFRNFIFRGNLLDLAVAVIMGTAFGAVVQSLVKDVLTPIIAALVGKPNFDSLTLHIGDGLVAYGRFLTVLVNFLFVATVIFFLLKAASRAQKLLATTDVPAEDAPPPSDEAVLLAEIRDLLASRA